MANIELIAATSFGLEAVVARELKNLGYSDQRTENGRVHFTGDEAAICRTNLWLRSAERILIDVGTFEVRDFGQLFDRTKALDWSAWLTPDAEFPVRGKSVRSQLHSVPDCQAIVKKAIVEKLKQSFHREWFEETGPLSAIEVSLLNDRATLTIDTTGAGLHKRGYRTQSGPAPLKESLAAALVQLSYWNSERPLCDPFCGTGTIPIEAALIGRNIAPGLSRTFAAEEWPRISLKFWEEARREALDLRQRGPALQLMGTDIDPGVLALARNAAGNAGVDGDIHFERRALSDLATDLRYGCVIANPPYGLRLGDVREAEDLYRQMRQVFATLDTWSIYILTAHPQFESLYGREADRRRKLYNGRIACTYYQFHGPRPPKSESCESAKSL